MTLIKEALAAEQETPRCGICGLLARIPEDEARDAAEMLDAVRPDDETKYLVSHVRVVRVLKRAFNHQTSEVSVRRCRSTHRTPVVYE